MRESFFDATSSFADPLAHLFRDVPASCSLRQRRHTPVLTLDVRTSFLPASAASCDPAMRLPCRMPRCLFP